MSAGHHHCHHKDSKIFDISLTLVQPSHLSFKIITNDSLCDNSSHFLELTFFHRICWMLNLFVCSSDQLLLQHHPHSSLTTTDSGLRQCWDESVWRIVLVTTDCCSLSSDSSVADYSLLTLGHLVSWSPLLRCYQPSLLRQLIRVSGQHMVTIITRIHLSEQYWLPTPGWSKDVE